MKRLVFALLMTGAAALARAQTAAPGAVAPDSAAIDSTAAHPAPAGAGAAASAPADSAAEARSLIERVAALEARRETAMVAADTKTLAEIFASDATYVHSTGIMQTRDELLRMLSRGDIKYVAFAVEKVAYRVYGRTVVATGVQRISLKSGGKPFESSSRYTVTYAAAGQEEKLVSYQSTPLPEVTTKKK